ncbi:unnamed protein product [Adineta steineri]|uniref:Uncharacterized protein n=1 Tax=Adineta steineri TaxID=433720 RepID=A0A815F984_9BILA|nr:unnamed protein product [Adineta steineri]CAF1322959.1 unnamed protein product [Adineta steineri]
MSVWDEQNISSSENLNKNVPTNSQSALTYYASKLGLKNNFRQVTPVVSLQRRLTNVFSPKDTPATFTNSPIVRSEEWPNDEYIRSNRTRRSSQWKSYTTSVRCRFTAFGFILGLLLGLAALIPIIIMWQTSASQTNSNTAVSSSVSATSFLTASIFFDSCSIYYCAEGVNFTTNMTLTALSLTITIQLTENPTLQGPYDTINPSIMSSNCTTSTNSIVCTFLIQGVQLPAGSYGCAVKLDLPSVNRITSADTYSVTATNTCGTVSSASGSF